jgi:hypothetical protein
MTQKYYKRQSITEDGEETKYKLLHLYSPFREGVGYNFKYKSTHIKSYLGVSLPLEKKEYDSNGKVVSKTEGFNDLELGRLYRVSKMMYSNSNLLARRVDLSIIPLTRDEVQKALVMHRTKFVPFWKKLFALKIMKIVPLDGRDYFCMNPLYYNTTTYMPLYLFLAFQKELQDHVPRWAIEKYLKMENPPKKDINKESETSV